MNGMRETQSKSEDDHHAGDVHRPVDAASTTTSSDSIRSSHSIPPSFSSASPALTLALSSPYYSSLLVQPGSVSTSIDSSINTTSSAQETPLQDGITSTKNGDKKGRTDEEQPNSSSIHAVLKQTEAKIPIRSNLKLVQHSSVPDPPGSHNDDHNWRAAGPAMANVELVEHREGASAPVVAELVPNNVEEVTTGVRREVEDQLATQQRLGEQRQQTNLILGVAIPDDGRDTSTTQEKEGENDTNFYICGLQAKTCVLILVALVVIGGAVGGALAALGGGGNSEPSIDVSDSPTMSPTTQPPTMSPTTQSPTLAPTTTPNPRLEYLLQVLEPKLASDEWWASLDDPLSPQSQALTWMSEEDTFFMNLEDIETQLLLERFALAVLFYSTSGPSWLSDLSFLNASKNVCTWNNGGKIGDDDTKGVYCNDASNFGIVTYLKLQDIEMRGTIPLEIALLNSLTYLHLAENDLFGTLPSQLSDISSLRVLSIFSNKLTGALPRNLPTALDYVSAYLNHLTGTLPSELVEDMTSLKNLDLSGNRFEGTLSTGLGRLSQLVFLNLDGNDFSGTIPTEVGLLTSMTWLYFSNNELEGPLPSEIGNLSLLKTFWVHTNEHLTGPVPETYNNLLHLQSFHFHDTSLTGSVDSMFCEDSSPPQEMFGDCLGTSPEIECSCCHYCCMENGTNCAFVTPIV